MKRVVPKDELVSLKGIVRMTTAGKLYIEIISGE